MVALGAGSKPVDARLQSDHAIEEAKHFITLGHVLADAALAEFGLQNGAVQTATEQWAEDLCHMDRNTVR